MPPTRGRDIFQTGAVMEMLAVIGFQEENQYSDIPNWSGIILNWSDKAVLLLLDDQKEVWLPLSQLRKADDGQSIYASEWILEQKGLA